MKGKSITTLGLLALGLVATIATITPQYVNASDHDDGEVDSKGRNVNLTDLYVFREGDQNHRARTDDLVFIMGTNPRSLARQQYSFSTNARYEFKVTRVGNKDETPTGREDVVLRFEFSPPDGNNQQQFTLSAIADGNVVGTATGRTTPLAPNPNSPPTLNQLNLGGYNLTAFAGLREDPFFFDVEQYFRVRAGALGTGSAVGFRPANKALDFATGYNINAIAVRVPRAFLQGRSNSKIFDIWQTISVKDPRTGEFRQFEQLARPGVNEALIVPDPLLAAFNATPPSQQLSPAAAPVATEALRVLKALGNNDQRANALLRAFVPDVMRIDTTRRSGYVNATNAQGSPITGRLLMDDVVDQTLTVLTQGKIRTDNVSYQGTPGNPATGHDPLVRDFPYLALPN